MNRKLTTVLLVTLSLGLGAVGAHGAIDEIEDILSAMDLIPARTDLDLASGTAEADLLAVASNASGNTDHGLRLRAIGALSLYPGPSSQSTLETLISERINGTGIDTLYLRAAARSLAIVAKSDAVALLAQLLTHPSRDVRASAAAALALTESTTAVPILRDRLGQEPVVQVRLALSAAIRDLTDAPLPE